MTPMLSKLSPRDELAHTQKNCVSAILAIAKLVSPELSEKSRSRMERLEGAARHLLDLINHDLDERRAGLEMPIATASTEELLRGVGELLRDRAESAGVVLVITCKGGWIHGDLPRLRECLSNLLGNAIEASAPAQAVYLDAEVTEEGDHLWTIQDTGVGMPEELLRQLGTPVRSNRPGGSGFGVAIATSIVHDHGGRVHFESARGAGTKITVWLPGPSRSH